MVDDDDDDVRRIVVESLQEFGYRVHEAADGATALNMQDTGISVAVVDFAMPGMNGAAMSRAVRRLYPELPIIFLTGYADTVALGAVPGSKILHKPLRMAELAEAVGDACRPLM